MTDRKPLARYGAMESALRERLAPAELHHKLGHGRPSSLGQRESPLRSGHRAYKRLPAKARNPPN